MTASGPADDRLIEAWLLDGVDAAPPPVVRAALDQIANTRQRRELAPFRRAHNVEATASLDRHTWLRLGLFGTAGVVVVMGLAAVANMLLPASGPPAASPPSRSTFLIEQLASPQGTEPVMVAEGSAALAALDARSRVPAFSQIMIGQVDADASAVLFDGGGTNDQRAYSAAAMTFNDSAAAAAAMATIKSGFRLSNGQQWAAGNSPFTDEHLPVHRDEGFERSGTWLAFGGTSATAQSRVGHLNVWRTGDVVFVVFGVDWDTPGSSDYQAAIEDGVIALSETLAARVP